MHFKIISFCPVKKKINHKKCIVLKHSFISLYNKNKDMFCCGCFSIFQTRCMLKYLAIKKPQVEEIYVIYANSSR